MISAVMCMGEVDNCDNINALYVTPATFILHCGFLTPQFLHLQDYEQGTIQ